jgi:hypothetical protein
LVLVKPERFRWRVSENKIEDESPGHCDGAEDPEYDGPVGYDGTLGPFADAGGNESSDDTLASSACNHSLICTVQDSHQDQEPSTIRSACLVSPVWYTKIQSSLPISKKAEPVHNRSSRDHSRLRPGVTTASIMPKAIRTAKAAPKLCACVERRTHNPQIRHEIPRTRPALLRQLTQDSCTRFTNGNRPRR